MRLRTGADMLNERDLKILDDKLYVPIAVREVLESATSLDADTQFRLHEILSNFQPDSALICIALTAREVLSLQGYPTMAVTALRMECDRIIEDYAPMWLEHANQKKIDDNVLFETLAQIPDDLADMAELLEITTEGLRSIDARAADILNILRIQAGAHAVIAEEFVDVMESAPPAPMPRMYPQVFTNNVIPFPLSIRA